MKEALEPPEVVEVGTGRRSRTITSMRQSSDGEVGYGLLEHGFFGPFKKYGMMDAGSGAA